MLRKAGCLFFGLFFLFSFGSFSKVEAADPQGKIYGIDDYAVTGSAWDPDCPGTPVEVHVYHGEPAGVVCYAAYDCPWPGVCDAGPKTGFWCVYRHPVNASSVPNDINIAVINKCGSGGNVWLDKSQAVSVKVIHDRERNTIFVDKPGYKIGISKRFGASIVEFYNKRIDSTVNLVQSDPGAAFQAAFFGYPTNLVGPQPNCFGNPPEKRCADFQKKVEPYFFGGTCGHPNNVELFLYDYGWGFAHPYCDLRYNPTQAGSHCGHPNGSEIRKCWTDGVEISCSNLPNTFTGGQLKFDVHFRNFLYPLSSTGQYPYRDFDDVYGVITYTFEETHVQVDYDIWKARDTKYGFGWSSLPVAFSLQTSRAVYKKDGRICTDYECKSVDNTDKYNPTWADNICVNDRADGRWVTILGSSEGVNDLGIRKTASPNDFLTLAFYNQPIKGSCPPRSIQLNFGLNGGGVQNSFAVQNSLYFEAEITHNMRARTLVFPYKYNEIPPGKSKNVGELVDTYTTNGGLMPEWECNIPLPTATPTPRPTNTPTPRPPTPTPTPTPTPKPGDINGDGKVDEADYAILMANFGKTGGRSQGDLTGDGKINEADYAVLIANFGK